MKSLDRNTYKEVVFLAFLLLGIVLFANAQDAEPNKRIKVEIQVTEDGNTSTTTQEIEWDDGDVEAQVQEMYDDIRMSLQDAINDLEDSDVEIIINTRDAHADAPFSPVYRHRMHHHMPRPPRPPHPPHPEAGPHAFLGVVSSAFDEDGVQGVAIESVVEGSAAEEAGLQEGDVITTIDDEVVASHGELARAISQKEPGSEVKLGVLREGASISKQVKLGERTPKYTHHWEDADRAHHIPGQRVKHKFPNRKVLLGIEGRSEDEEGILVTKVFEGSAAEAMGIKVGDHILQIGEEDLDDIGELVDVLQEHESGDKVKIKIDRDGKESVLKGELKPMPAKEELFPRPMPGKSVSYRFEMESVDADRIHSLNKQGGTSLDTENSLGLTRWNVGPNPSDGVFMIDALLQVDSEVELIVLDRQGRKVVERTEKPQGNEILTRVDLSEEPSGVYFLALTQSGKSKVVRIVKH